MSATVRTITEHRAESDAPFFHTFPLWVIDALSQQGFKAHNAVSIKVMPKTAEVEFPSAVTDSGSATLKVRRVDAFPGRSV